MLAGDVVTDCGIVYYCEVVTIVLVVLLLIFQCCQLTQPSSSTTIKQ